MPGTLRLFSFRGVNVYLHWSWALVAFIELQVRNDAYQSQAWNALEYVSLFAIVLMHEFGHVLACRSVGGSSDRILLWPLGGVAYVQAPPRPGALLWSIAAGPPVNVALLPPTIAAAVFLPGALPQSHDFGTFLTTLATINIVLLVFNLLPIYPLDGGQMVQALLWFFVGQARSLYAASVIGLVGAAAAVAAALYWSDPWLIVLAVFGAMRSLSGFRTARLLRMVEMLPRREGPTCPSCHQAPPVGRFWRCRCGAAYDAFAFAAVCPFCNGENSAARCPNCGALHAIEAWEPSTTMATPPTS